MNLQEKFKYLENMLLNDRDTFHIQIGAPFILFIYNPYEEMECRRKVKELSGFLNSKNIKVLEIPLNTFVFEILAEYNSLEDVFEKEKNDIDEFIRGISQIYNQKIKQYILSQIKDKIETLFITRIGSLFPFYRTSDIVDKLLNFIEIPTVFFYPGTYIKDYATDEEEILFFGKYSSDSTYRTYPIGWGLLQKLKIFFIMI